MSGVRLVRPTGAVDRGGSAGWLDSGSSSRADPPPVASSRRGGAEGVSCPNAGVATPATPHEIAFFLDQARRVEAVAAYTAAIVMYRSALEQLLHEQGFRDRMLGNKIKALLNAEAPPAWRERLDPAYLDVIKDLGNAAVHAGGDDIDRHRIFETALLRQVHALFAELLDEIYEHPKRSAARLESLRAAADTLSDAGS